MMLSKSLILLTVLIYCIPSAHAADVKRALPKTTLASLVQHGPLPQTTYGSLVKEAMNEGKAENLYGHEGTFGPPIFAAPEPSFGEEEAMSAAMDSNSQSAPEAAPAPWGDAD
jgi:hypothetical protein